jgi:hypothetical protein
LINKIFIGVKRDGTYEVHRSVYSPRGNKYKSLIQVEFENMFDPDNRKFTCRVEHGFTTNESLWNFINDWAASNILVEPQDVVLGSAVYYIKDPDKTIAGPGSVVVVTGNGSLIAEESFQIVAYGKITVYKKTNARVDAWDNVTISMLN